MKDTENKQINSAFEGGRRFCDLHTHSIHSDGSYTPTELIDEAERIGLAAIALCDHNGVGGLPEFLEAAKGRDLEAIAGIEISVDYNGKEIHMLALGIRPEYFDEIDELMDDVRRRKEQSNVDLVNALASAGYDVDYDKIRAERRGTYINRVHIAAQLIARGYVKSNKEAFDTLLSKTGGFYKEPKRPSAFEMIGFIKKIGAVSILAHPFLNLDESELREFLSQAKEYGLDGMETLYSDYDSETIALSRSIADEYGLMESGGSDFHGANRPHVSMGRGTGALEIPASFAERIIDRAKRK